MQTYHWAVIGAGPAGIAAVGKLIDNGIDPEQILWVDPEFKVGDFGTKWKNVSSNTRVKLFLKFYHACKAFQFASAPKTFAIHDIHPDETCLLSLAAQPLQWITEKLKESVHSLEEKVSHLKAENQHWNITLANATVRANNIILANGAEPKSLDFANIQQLPLDIALDPQKLATHCDKNDVIAVFGSSHSAIIIIQSLLEVCNTKKIINFYLEPLRYAVYFDDWILYDDTGLKGKTAEWAHKNLDGRLPEKLQRILSTQENIQTFLPECSKAIYATGFQKRFLSVESIPTLEYNNKNGIIAPGLFGLGIAFPEAKYDRLGNLEYRVGLWKFMEYLQNVIPVWMKGV